MKCKQFEDRLNSSVDGGLSENELREFKEHLDSCPNCARALADLKKTKGWLDRLEEVEPPPWFEQKIMQGVRSEGGKKTVWQKLFQPLQVKLPIGALATAVVVIIAVQVFRTVEPEVKTTIAPAPAPAPVAEVAGKNQSASAPAAAAPKAIDRTAPAAQPYKAERQATERGPQELKKDSPAGSAAQAPAKLSRQLLKENEAERARSPVVPPAPSPSLAADYAGPRDSAGKQEARKMRETYSNRLDRRQEGIEKGTKDLEEAPRSFESQGQKKTKVSKPAQPAAEAKARAGATAGSYSPAGQTHSFRITLNPNAPETAMEDIKSVLREFKAGNITMTPSAGLVTADVPADRLAEISAKLARFGEVRPGAAPSSSAVSGTAGTIRLSISIESPQPAADKKAN